VRKFFRRLTLSVEFSFCGENWLLPKSFALDALFVFMPVESERSALRATWEE